MPTCPACGHDARDGLAVCPECSAPLGASIPPPDGPEAQGLTIPPPVPEAGGPDVAASLPSSAPAFVVVLEDAGPRKIVAIKITREATGLGLADAKRFVEAAPLPLPAVMEGHAAMTLAQDYREAGSRADVMPLEAAEKRFGPISFTATRTYAFERRAGCTIGLLGLLRLLWR